MAQYVKNKDGYYKASVVLGYTPDGKQKRATVRSKSLTEFKEKLKAMQNLKDQGYDFDSKGMTVNEWADKWLETYKKPQVRQHCYETYEINLRLHIKPLIGYLPLAEVKSFQLQEVLNKQEGKSKSNTQKIMFCLKQMFKKAYTNGLIVKDISDGLVLPSTTEGTRRPLTSEEKVAVIKAAASHRAGLWVLTMLYAGLRPEETVALMWSDFDFTPNNETVTIRRAAEWVNGRAKIKGVKGKDKKKGKEAERTIPLSPALVEKLKAASRKGLYVFTPAQSDGMLTQTNVKRLWHSFHREVDLAMGAETYRNKIKVHAFSMEVTPYYLRHTCCTDWFEMGLDLKTVQYLMGHSDIKTTANIYTHFMEKSLKKAGDIIRGHFKERGQNGDNLEVKN